MKHVDRFLLGIAVATVLAVALTMVVVRRQGALANGGIIYVCADAIGENNGTSWDDAFTDLQDALAEAEPGHQIWVAEGIYKPTSGTDRTASFQMKNSVAIYGGFDPSVGDITFEDRDWVANETILSGDIGTAGDPGDNSYHVFYHPEGTNLDSSAVLDGFTVTGGNANGDVSPHRLGGGMHNFNGSSPTVSRCTFSGNSAQYGGGIYNYYHSSPTLTDCTFTGNESDENGGGMSNHNSSPVLTNCTFTSNSADDLGGGIYNEGSSSTLTGCTFSGNTAGHFGGGMADWGSSAALNSCTFVDNTADRGGGMYNYGSGSTLTNCTFRDNSALSGGGIYNYCTYSVTLANCSFESNSAVGEGGGIYNGTSTPRLTNCSIFGNSAYRGGGMHNYDSSPTVTNCILWGNSPDQLLGSSASVTYSDIEGGYDGEGNIDTDPLFVDAGAGDLRLQDTSPAIDAGDNNAPGLAGVTTDRVGNPRFVDVIAVVDTGNGEPPIVDMGAYEALPGVIFVDEDATGANDGSSWNNAYTTLQPALDAAVEGDQIWVAEGVYTPIWQYDVADPRSATFQLRNDVAIYGGFDPSLDDIAWEDRDWVTHETILSGDLNGDDGPDFENKGENSYHVFYHPCGTNLDDSAVLDGFTTTGGNANGDSAGAHYGGGMYNCDSSPTVTNCTFLGNSATWGGGGMRNTASGPSAGSRPVVTNCTFTGNSGGSGGGGMDNLSSSPAVTGCTFSGNLAQHGGGMRNHGSSPTVTNCTFSGNSVWQEGGGMFNISSPLTLTNCTFSDNSADSKGGGMYNELSSPTVTNCVFSGNSAHRGGGMYNYDLSSPTVTNCTFSGNSAGDSGGGIYNYDSSSPAVTNCILWGNAPNELFSDASQPTVSYSDIQGGYGEDGNIDADPRFVDAGNGNFHLGPDSPCIDAGSNDAEGLPAYDFEGDDRILDGDGDGAPIVDMGVDEAFWYPTYLPAVLRDH